MREALSDSKVDDGGCRGRRKRDRGYPLVQLGGNVGRETAQKRLMKNSGRPNSGTRQIKRARASRRGVFALLLILGTVLTFAGVAVAAAGDLDPTFDDDGKRVIDFGSSIEQAEALVVQSDGKLLVAGSDDRSVIRLNPNGSTDIDFGTNGKVSTSQLVVRDVALQADGKIVVAGMAWGGNTQAGDTGYDFALARYEANGSPDTTFGASGITTTPIGSGTAKDEAASVAIAPDGDVVLAGSTQGTPSLAAVARYDSAGDLDDTFDADGKATTDFGSSGDASAYDLVVQADGKMVVAGGTSNGDFALARFNLDGSFDPAFGTDGKVLTDFGGIEWANALGLHGGSLVAAGTSIGNSGSDPDFAVARYASDGSLDTSFDTDGKVTTGVGDVTGFNSADHANDVAVQSDGKVVLAGTAETGTNTSRLNDFAVARYASDGALDTSFGEDGTLMTDFGSDGDIADAVAIQSDGKIVAAGRTGPRSSGPRDFALARYDGGDADGDGVPDSSDNCPTVANAGQQDQDGDGKGDVCDSDGDGDGVANASDSCPTVASSGPQGCPTFTRSLTLRYVNSASAFRGALSSANAECEKGPAGLGLEGPSRCRPEARDGDDHPYGHLHACEAAPKRQVLLEGDGALHRRGGYLRCGKVADIDSGVETQVQRSETRCWINSGRALGA